MVQVSITEPNLTAQQVADILNISYRTVYRMMHSGELPYEKVGGTYRIRYSDLRDYRSSVYHNTHISSNGKI